MKKNSPSGERRSLGKRKTDNFSKFYNKKRNSAIKEAFRQEKKAAKKERKQSIERLFEERRQARTQQPAPGVGRPAPAGPTHNPRAAANPAPHSKAPKPTPQTARPAKPTPGKPIRPLRSGNQSRPLPPGNPASAPHSATPTKPGKPIRPLTPGNQSRPQPPGNPGKPPRPHTPGKPAPTPHTPHTPHTPGTPAPAKATPGSPSDTLPLNKYISNGGICSRRDAAQLVRAGKVTVNGKLITEPGTKVHPSDTIKVSNKKVTISNNFVYILLNKPKDYITTTEDPQGRRTVLDLIRPATTERVFPIGRLDRNTSGVLLFTNDGELAQKLAHPSHQIRKIYHVTLDRPLTKADFDKIAAGAVTLEDGPAPVDDLAYPDPKDKTQIGLEIHSGRNRIVRRIFEQLGYDVRGLDRVMYAGLTKKNVQRGHWRLLSEKEIRILKYLNSSIKGSPGRAKDMASTPGEIKEEVRILRTSPSAENTPPRAKPALHPQRDERPP
ncbi:MAG TPA: pseudouridine synthase, partial [Puia sp.]|nr:pseudouridine synthase [Puia sp.]